MHTISHHHTNYAATGLNDRCVRACDPACVALRGRDTGAALHLDDRLLRQDRSQGGLWCPVPGFRPGVCVGVWVWVWVQWRGISPKTAWAIIIGALVLVNLIMMIIIIKFTSMFTHPHTHNPRAGMHTHAHTTLTLLT